MKEARQEGLFSNIPGVVGTEPPVVTVGETNRGQFAGINNITTQEQKNIAGGVVGVIAATSVLVVLLLFVVVRRRKGTDPVKHISLDDDSQMDRTYDSEGFISPLKSHLYEEESEFSGPDNGGDGILKDLATCNNELNIISHTDVHQCASATCEICRNRRLNPEFIRIKPPARKPRKIPFMQRNYITEDTVVL